VHGIPRMWARSAAPAGHVCGNPTGRAKSASMSDIRRMSAETYAALTSQTPFTLTGSGCYVAHTH
jgi:hypothetical protein